MPEESHNIVTPDGLPLLQCWTKRIVPGAHAQQMQCYAALRIVRIGAGRARWQIGTDLLPALPGDVFLFNNYEPRRIAEILPGEPLLLETVAFLPVAVYPNQAVLSVFFGKTRTKRLPAAEAGFLYSALRELWQEAADAKVYQTEMLQALLTKITVLLARCCAAEVLSAQNEEEYHRIMQTMLYLHQHITEPLQEKMLAQRAGMSTSAFSRAFRRYNGITLAAYLRRCRVQLALDRIRAGNGNVLDTALQCGFSSSSGFYKAVREVTGQPPRRCFGTQACNLPAKPL